MQPMFGYGVAKVLDFGHLDFEVTSMKKKKNGWKSSKLHGKDLSKLLSEVKIAPPIYF